MNHDNVTILLTIIWLILGMIVMRAAQYYRKKQHTKHAKVLSYAAFVLFIIAAITIYLF